MKLPQPFVQLPWRVDVAPLQADLRALPPEAWRPHPQGFAGNDAVPLISCGGDPSNDQPFGVMGETPWLQACPALRRTLRRLGVPLGRTRLMRLAPGAEVREHVDTHPYWWDHLRVHVPLVTSDAVVFYCGYQSTQMQAGEAWVFDTWRPHRVVNGGPAARVHLVCDVEGAPARGALWRTERPDTPGEGPLPLERYVAPALLSTHRLRRALSLLFEEEPLREDGLLRLGPLRRALRELEADWAALHARGASAQSFARRRDEASAVLQRFEGLHRLRNRVDPVAALRARVLATAVADHPPQPLGPPTLTRPVVIACPPRSGSSLLFEALQSAPGVYSLGQESHALIDADPALHPAARGFESHALEAPASAVADALRARLLSALRGHGGGPAPSEGPVRVVEKTPKSCLRLPFLETLLPDARFVLLLRAPRPALSSLLDGWRSQRFVTCPQLPGWRGPEGLAWSFLLTSGWRALAGAPLWRVVAEQWRAAAEALAEGLERLPEERTLCIQYEHIVSHPREALGALCEALALPEVPITDTLPLSQTTLDPPHPEKWRRNAAEVERALPLVEAAAARLQAAAKSVWSPS